MSMHEPGLDRHEWESEMASLEDDLRDEPARALPELADLVGRILTERGYALDEPITREGDDPEIVSTYLSAREVADRCEVGDGADPGDVADAIDGLRAVYDTLIAGRSP
jgi:hypothetical protein